ncbi:MAG: FG-GAP-like repeat-containing protein, partial [Pseudomonadota bacterium]|nr:FG-GAP-like repeat-containing protein [Pseudomonadota bacterium]
MSLTFEKQSSHVWNNTALHRMDLVAFDYDGDGRDDIAVMPLNWPPDPTPLDVTIFQNQGANQFTDTSAAIVGGTVQVVHARDFVVGDFNGDAKDDLFIADHGYDSSPFPGFQNALLLTTATGLTNATDQLPQAHDFTHSTGASDVEGDGDLDLIVGNIWGQNLIDPQIALNDGGVFTNSTTALPSEVVSIPTRNRFVSQDLHDLDGDGYPDLILGADYYAGYQARYPSGTSLILKNDGGGSFQEVLHQFVGPFGAYSTALDIDSVDVNSDGRIDLLVTFTSTASENWYDAYETTLLVQNAAGAFIDETAARLPADNSGTGNWRKWLHPADFDGEGDIDFLNEYSGSANSPTLWVNGGGVFESQALFDESGRLAVGDFDGDGAPDILLGNRTTFFTMMNTTTTYGAATLTPTAAADSFAGNAWDQTVSGAAGADTLSGGGGADLIYGNKGADRRVGGTGADTLFGGQQSDAVFGLSGADQVYGNKQNDTLHGGLGDDSLFGGQNDDLLYGQFGNDRVDGNRGDDTLYGEDGTDTFVIS